MTAKSQLTTTVMLAVLITGAAPAAAQVAPSIAFNSGITTPVGADARFFDSGFNVGATFEFGVTEQGSFQVHTAYHGMRLDDEEFLDDLGVSGNDVTLRGGAATATLMMVNGKRRIGIPGTDMSGFVLLGVGLFRSSVRDIIARTPFNDIVLTGGQEWALGFETGAGVSRRLNDAVTAFAQVDYVIGFTEDDRMRLVPFRLGFLFGLPHSD